MRIIPHSSPVTSPAVTPARERIVDLLRWGPATVDELASQVELTSNGVRAQLIVLQRDGMVEQIGVRPSGEAGKPPTLYALTPAAQQELSQAYPAALVALINSIRATQGDHQLLQVLGEAGRELGAATTERDPIRLLESLGAKVRVNSTADRVRIEGAGCPLSAAVREQPLSCELVRAMLASATGVDVKQCCQHGDTPRCCFDIATPTS